MGRISFILFTFNEEKRIEYAIRNFCDYGQVYVFDGGSTDKTKEIAEKLGALFFVRPPSTLPQIETQENFEFIKSKIKTDWIYWGYVDNLAPKSLVEKMIEVAEQDTAKMVLVPLYTYLWGNTKHLAQKSYTPFLFHKDFVDFSNNYIHGMGKFLGGAKQIVRLPNKSEYAIRHFSVYNTSKFVPGHLRYAEQEALGKYAAGKKFSFIRMLAGMIRYLWIYRRSLRNGVLGFIIVSQYAFFRLMAYARLYELEHGLSVEEIEKSYSVIKQEMLKEFNTSLEKDS